MNVLFLVVNAMAYTKSDFDHIAKWQQQPQIVMCSDTKVKKENLQKAIGFWQQAGYNISNNITEKYCGHDLYVANEIRIAGQRNLDTVRYYGMTERQYYGENNQTYLLAANIKFGNNDADNLELIIHELGHALGIEHEKHDESHIMHHLVIESSTRYN